MTNEFDITRAIEKEAVHDDGSEPYAIQKAKELNWDTFKASKAFINMFRKENRISSRRYNKLSNRLKSDRRVFTLNGISKI